MPPKGLRAALYLRVSTDGQTVENQRLALTEVAERRGWSIVATFEDAGISGGKGRDKRPGFDAALKAASRRRYDVLLVWAIDRLGRSIATVATTLDDLKNWGVSIFSDKESMDATTPHGRAMLHMAAVFAELEREMIRGRVLAGLERARSQGVTLGRPKTSDDMEARILERLQAGRGILKVAKELGVGVSVVQRVKRTAVALADGDAAQDLEAHHVA